jgi:Na+/melibiose symporter-like transporter
MLVMPIYATGSVLLYLLAFRNLKEVVPTESAPQSLLGGFGAMMGNWPWLLIFASSFCFWIAFIARVSTVPYFFEYTLGRKDLIPIANALDFVSLASVFFMPWLCRRWSKATVWAGGLIGLVLGQLIVAYGLQQGNSVSLVMVGWTVGFLASGVAMAMPFSVLSDSVDYGEWKTGIRAAGLLTAIGAAFCLKAGAGLGGALPGWILQSTGYTAGIAQSAEALRGIEWAVLWVPALFFAVAAVPVLFYRRFEKLEPAIQAELALRRSASSGGRG